MDDKTKSYRSARVDILLRVDDSIDRCLKELRHCIRDKKPVGEFRNWLSLLHWFVERKEIIILRPEFFDPDIFRYSDLLPTDDGNEPEQTK